MTLEFTSGQALQWLGEVLRTNFITDENEYKFPLGHAGKEIILTIAKEHFNKVMTSLGSLTKEGTELYDRKTYEVLVRMENSIGGRRLRSENAPYDIRDSENSILYRLAAPSDEYFLYILYRLSSFPPLRNYSTGLGSYYTEKLVNSPEESLSAIDAAKLYYTRFLTLRLESTRDRKLHDFRKHMNAYLFQIGFNLDVALVPMRLFEDLERHGRIRRGRRVAPEEIEPPKRTYISELIYHYQMAIAAENPSLSFLSYYHIAEHFFKKIFNEDLIEKVRRKITQPGFSYKRDNDIGSMINELTKAVKYRENEQIFSESDALYLVLKKYIAIGELKGSLDEYESSLIDYYRDNKVEFSDGDAIDFSVDVDDVLRAIAGRIYKTRNSIVHSKDGDLRKYIPFTHDKILSKEIPILRFIAEMIIIKTSNII